MIACTVERHEARKASEWHTLANHRPWPDAGLVLAECPDCGSTLAVPVANDTEAE